MLAGLLARADAGTLVDPADGHVVSSWELLDITQFFFSRPRWTQLADWWRSLSTGTGMAAGFNAAAARPRATKHTKHAKQGELVEDVRVHFCQDWSVPVRDHEELDRMWRASLRVAPRMRTLVLAMSSITGCIGWPGRVNNPQHRLRVSGTPTILMLNWLHDPATGYLWAQNAARQLGPAAVLVTYEGSGHVAYTRNTCTRGLTDRYLVDLTVPPAGTRCPATDPALTTTTDEQPDEAGRW